MSTFRRLFRTSKLIAVHVATGYLRPDSAPSTREIRKDRFITNYDALKLIFSLFVPPLVEGNATELPLAVEGRKQLRDLALVCRAFVEPALDCLWENLFGIRPLLDIHPALKIIDGTYCLIHVNHSRVAKYERCSRRVRGLRLGTNTIPNIAFASYVWLGEHKESSPLLPALQEICFEGPSGNTAQLGLLSSILSPSVKAIDLRGPFIFNDLFTSYTLPLVAVSAKSIRRLSLYDSSSPQYRGIWGRLPKVAGSLPLRILDIQFANNNTLPNAILERLLAKCGDLTSMTLDVHTPSHGASDDFISPHLLPFLSVLHLVCRSGTNVCSCYPQSLLRRATSITLYLHSTDTNDDAFSEAIGTLATLPSLRNMELRQGSLDGIYVPHLSLIPFLQRLNLEEFRVHIWGLSVGSDLSAGQDIVDLRGSSGDIDTTPLCLALRKSPRRVPGLEHLALSIDSSIAGQNGETLQSLLDKCSGLGSTSGLRHLQLADTRQRNTLFTPTQYRNLARFLDTLFPNLESVSMMDSPFRDKNWDEHWTVVEEIRRDLKELRLYRSGRLE
ncbi:hypothetical protein NMY22_g370 [Coprinellus aureogranulatus]|nr:hypothetical protein NMY22_g370 [Coprinellus aureogranulatus]